MSVPTGPIKSPAPGGGSFGIDWEAITKYDAIIHKEVDPVGWPIERIRATIAIESRGERKAVQENNSNGWSYGLMQVVPYGTGWAGWHALVREKAGLPRSASERDIINALYTPEVNIAVGVAILESFYQQHGTLDKAQSAFFIGRSDWSAGDTVNMTTGFQYRDALNALVAEQKAFAPPDPIAIIVGGSYPPIDYGFKADAGLNYYAYGVGHGTQRRTQHTGYDVSVPLGTRLYTPISGVVDCVGGNGTSRWGQGCGAYNDTITGGVGNITILGESGHKLTLGHCNKSLVAPRERVTAGQQVGTSGGMNGPHVHIEVSVFRNGTYWLLDPGPALLDAMGGVSLPPPPPPAPVYAERLPIPQPGEFEVWWEVEITEDGVPLLQRASLDAPHVASPFVKGETFKAVYITLGNDNRPYWISTMGTRVPLDGTRCPNGPKIHRGDA